MAFGAEASAPAPVPVPPVPVSNEIACVIGPEFAMYSEHSGSTTIAVCDALRSRGAKVGPVVYAAAGFRSAYVVRLRPPGSSWSIAVTYEEPVGNPVKTRWISVDNFKEIPDAAEALAKSLVDDDSTPNAEVQQIADFGGTIDGWIGGGSSSLVDGNAEGGIALGATGLLHYKFLSVGAGLTATTALFGESASIVSGLAGFRYDPVPWFRFDLLGEGGAETVRGAGSGMFSRTIRESSGTLPYVGGRASLSFLIGRKHRFLLGWWFNSGSTIGEKLVTSTVESCFFGCSINTDTHTVGGPSFTTGLRIGGFIH